MARVRKIYKLGIFNLLVSSKSKRKRTPEIVKDEVVRFINKHKLIAVGVQESTEYIAGMRTIPGFKVYTGKAGQPGSQHEVALLVREDIKVTNVSSVAQGNGWLKAPFFRSRMRPRIFLVATLHLNKRLRVAVIHNPAGVQLQPNGKPTPPDRGDDLVAMMNRVGRFFMYLGARIALGDWNIGARNTLPHSPQAVAKKHNAEVKSPDAGIDYAVVKNLDVSDIYKDKVIPEESDHEPVVVVVEL